jgi:site-specific recombinase XerC
MSAKVPIRELVGEVLVELERLKYSQNTLNFYRRFYNRLVRFADSIGETQYSEDLGNEYLRAHHQFDLDTYKNVSHHTFRGQARCIRVLGDYQLHGAIIRRRTTKVPYERTPEFAEALEAFEKECEQRNYSVQGMRGRIYRTRLFIDYLDSCGLLSLSLLTAQHLSDYTRTIAGYHRKSISAILTTLRSFLKFLYLKGYHERDLADDVPKVKQWHCPKIPSVWKPEDVRRVLETIDRGNPNGKRDYAILLMVARLGIRVQDIKEIRLSNLNWAAKTIDIIQHKTKREISYPMLDDIGWAIIDYLRRERK